MHLTRRELIRLGLGSSALLACGATVPQFLATSATAMSKDSSASTAKSKGRILVVVQLNGGNDGLNTIIPYRDDEYRKRRPTIQIATKDVKKIDDHIGFHPQLNPFANLLETGRLALVQSVGYPNPNRSHFESMAIWQTAQTAPDLSTPGWLAQAIDAHPTPSGVDMQGLHIHESASLPRTLQGGRNVIPSLARLEQFQRRLGVPSTANPSAQAKALDQITREAHGNPGSLLQFIERCSLIAYTSSARLEQVRQQETKTVSGTAYPEFYGLARQLKLISQLIKAGLSTPIYYTQLDGFDTHSSQAQPHATLMRQISISLKAFLDDIEAAGEANRVLVLVFSEFGRRLTENASAGTDHGTAAPVFLLGKPVSPGVYGPYPDLTRLDDEGDPHHTIDFRRIYATILSDWLGVSPTKIVGPGFNPLPLLHG
jgi:uncharacterized protein (DUF1501 family)